MEPVFSPDVDTRGLVTAAELEASIETQSRVCLPAGWIHVLPVQDQQWISKALFKWSRTGQPELDITRVDRMWWYPPQPSLAPQGVPPLERYFGHPLFLWMPRKLWQVKILCPHGDCGKEELTSSGLHESVQQVVGVSGTYFMGSEYLVCKGCKRKSISWSNNIIQQLDACRRVQFPCLLTSRLGCDMQVVRMMQQRGPGNSSSQIWSQLAEQHAEVWLQKQLRFLTACCGVARAASAGSAAPVALGNLPTMIPVPKHRWLMQVYCQDVLGRLEEIKASITSLFGRVLKMDSTKKIVKKLADESHSTASWATNICNEHGQIIMSVLTAGEGYGLGKMIGGLIRRYQDAGVPPPEVLYVDRDCCGSTHLHSTFRTWGRTQIRLDVWHFMQRIAKGCNSSSHSLYAGFMNQLSRCIFIWDEDDMRALKEAKCAELAASGIHLSSPAHVMRHISKAEMALHCRQTTRSCTEMKTLIAQLLAAYDGVRGHNTHEVPLIHSERMAEIWRVQKTHLGCLQDPPGVQLYMQTGTLKKGGLTLPTYRCARGSASLERFHLYVNRFIPGTLASAMFFQAYLVNGVARWNEDRGMAAEGRAEPHSYSSPLQHAVNQLAEKVLGLKLVNCKPPRKYTGELIGVEYLFDQTGSTLEDFKHTLAAMETDSMAVAEDEDELQPEEVEDFTVPLLEASPLNSTSATAPPQTADDSPAPPSDGSTSAADDNIPGCAAVQELARCLVSLRDRSLALTQEEARHIIDFWNALSDVDMGRTTHPPPNQDALTKGQFTATKQSVAPGVESTKRCFVGAAQWPNCDRLVEAIFILLCMAFTDREKSNEDSQSRWTQVIHAYSNIRQCVLNSACVMTETGIQLPEVDTATLTQWYNKRSQAQQPKVIQQGTESPKASTAGPVQQPSTAAVGDNPHTFVLPDNTAGVAGLNGQPPFGVTVPPSHSLPPVVNSASALLQHPPTSTSQLFIPVVLRLPRPPGPRSQVPRPPGPRSHQQLILPAGTCEPPVKEDVPYTTQRNRKRRREREQAGVYRRKYTKKSDLVVCRRCQKDRRLPGHHQYYGNWYCAETATESLEEWREHMAAKGYGRRKKEQARDGQREREGGVKEEEQEEEQQLIKDEEHQLIKEEEQEEEQQLMKEEEQEEEHQLMKEEEQEEEHQLMKDEEHQLIKEEEQEEEHQPMKEEEQEEEQQLMKEEEQEEEQQLMKEEEQEEEQQLMKDEEHQLIKEEEQEEEQQLMKEEEQEEEQQLMKEEEQQLMKEEEQEEEQQLMKEEEQEEEQQLMKEEEQEEEQQLMKEEKHQ